MKKLYFAIEKRLAWFCTMLSLAFVSLISPELIEYALRQYREDEIIKWWGK
jgi:hypothetical protein